MLEEALTELATGQDLIGTAIRILSDGKPRKAAEILADALERGLLKPTTTVRAVEDTLTAYIARTQARGSRPLVVLLLAGHRFRINRPADDWPNYALAPRPRYTSRASLDAIASRLHSTAVGPDPAAFEQAICDAFGMLGFVAQHVGGQNEPDGTLDAPLGPFAYRAVLECKTGHADGVVNNPRPEEPAKFRDIYEAQYAVIVGPAFIDSATFLSELHVHKISAWTVDALITAIGNDVDAFECRELFAPGYVDDALGDLVWLRAHGKEKRLAILRDVLRREGDAEQRTMVGRVKPADMPVLTLDAAMILVTSAMQRAGSTVAPDRDELRQAMNDLVSADEAVMVPERDGIVIRRGAARLPAQPSSSG